jgi:Holliday junction DNA helicase RuvA
VYDFLRGRIVTVSPARVVVEVAGVGWLLHVPEPVSARLRTGQDSLFYTHLAVSESALTLFAFGTEFERRLFRRLIQVGGIGPSRALDVMSSVPPESLVRAIVESDVARLTAVRGVGKKTAERLVVELRDHLREWVTGSTAGTGATPTGGAAPPDDDLMRVLMDLGAPQVAAARAAERARRNLGDEAGFQELLRHALHASA